MRKVQEEKCGKAASGTCVEELFELYMRLGESFGAKRLKKEYPGILKNTKRSPKALIPLE